MEVLTTGGLMWGSATRWLSAPLNRSRSMTSLTTPMVRLPTYTSRCFLLDIIALLPDIAWVSHVATIRWDS